MPEDQTESMTPHDPVATAAMATASSPGQDMPLATVEGPSDPVAFAPQPALRLSDRPDWLYLMREFKDLYRRNSAGGSQRIRSHQRVVREAVSRVIGDNPPISARPQETRPVVGHLGRALDQGRRDSMASLVRAVERVAPELSWLWGYEKVPRTLAGKYAYAEFAGPYGPIVTHRIILGVVLFAPKTTYPAHSHDGLTESYVCLSGAVSENDDGVFVPGSMIFNPPGRMHRITTGDHEPTLLAYAWAGSAEKLEGQKMVFTRKRKGPG